MKTSTTTYCLLAALAGLAAAQDQPPQPRTTILLASDGDHAPGAAGGVGVGVGRAIAGSMPSETVPTFEARDLAEPVRWAIQRRDVFDEPQRSGPVTFLGVSAIPVPHELAVHLPLAADTGLGVEGLVPDSPAAKAGLEKSDVLMKLDDQILIHPRQLSVLVANRKEGDSVKLTYLRKGEVKESTVTLGKREVEPGKEMDKVILHHAFGDKAPLRTYLRHFEVPGADAKEAPGLQEMKKKMATLRGNINDKTAGITDANKRLADSTLSEEVRRAAEAAYSAEVQRAIQEAKQADAAKDAAESATKVEIDELRTKLDAVLKLLEEKK